MMDFGDDELTLISEVFTNAIARPIKALSPAARYAEATALAPARALCRRFRDDIDAACAKEFDTNPELHVSANAMKHIERLQTKGFVSFTAMRSHTCVLCCRPFSGCVSELGVYAHQECINKAKRVTLFYMQSPMTKKATERLSQTHPLLPGLVEENVDLSSVRRMEVSGYRRGMGSYSYETAFLGPHVPSLPRSATVLGAAFPTDIALEARLDAHLEARHKREEEEGKRRDAKRARADALALRRDAALKRRIDAFEARRGAVAAATLVKTAEAFMAVAVHCDDVTKFFSSGVLKPSTTEAEIDALADAAEALAARKIAFAEAMAVKGFASTTSASTTSGDFFKLVTSPETTLEEAVMETVEAEKKRREQKMAIARRCTAEGCNNTFRMFAPAMRASGPVCGACERM